MCQARYSFGYAISSLRNSSSAKAWLDILASLFLVSLISSECADFVSLIVFWAVKPWPAFQMET